MSKSTIVKKSKPKRRYTDEERANALIALEANGGNVLRTSRQLGIPYMTLVRWTHGECHPEVLHMRDRKRLPLAERFDAIAHLLLDKMPSKITEANLQQIATAAAIAVDKSSLLRGLPTNITANGELTDEQKLESLRQLYYRVQERKLASSNGARPQITDARGTGTLPEPTPIPAQARPERANGEVIAETTNPDP